MVNWVDYVQKNTLKIFVKPNAPKTRIVSWDEHKGMLKVEVKGKPEGGEANHNLLKFFSKMSGKIVYILSGKTSRRKVIGFE